jgi:hypothetical protein
MDRLLTVNKTELTAKLKVYICLGEVSNKKINRYKKEYIHIAIGYTRERTKCHEKGKQDRDNHY